MKFRDISKNNIDKFRVVLRGSDWDNIMGDSHDSNIYVNNFLEYFYSTFNKCFPIKTKLVGTKRLLTPWLTNSLIKSIRLKHYRYKLMKNGQYDKCNYTIYCKLLTKLIKISKNRYFASVFSDLKTDIKKTWRLLNNVIGLKSKRTENIDVEVNGVKVESSEVPNKFNQYFTTIGKKIKDDISTNNVNFLEFLPPSINDSIFINSTSPPEIEKVIKSLNCNKVGTKLPKGRVYKIVSEFISIPISKIFNTIISTSEYPKALKISCVSPIYKKDDPLEIKNYRPISCLPILNVIIEKLLHLRFNGFFEKREILFKNQFGFRRNHSTSDAVLKLVDRIYDAYDKSQYFGSIMLDLSKAFDTVDHNILLSKLYNYGIRGVSHKLIKSYLSERKQYVFCNDTVSETLPVSVGVPQGSVLGPLLFLVYVNDMSTVLTEGASVIQYADDTTLYCSKSNVNETCRILSTNLSRIKIWLDSNYLSLNISKTHFTIFTNKSINQDISIELESHKINYLPNPTFLGITLDQKLTFDEHIKNVKNKVSKSIGILWKVNHLPTDILKTLYYTLIYPYLLYCLLAWGSALKTRLHFLFLKQKKAVRIISKSNYLDPSGPIFKELKILKLEDLFDLYCAVFMYKIMNENYNSYFYDRIQSFQLELPYNTRNNQLRMPFFTLTRCKQNFTYQGISVWNKIPDDIKTNKTSRSFKKHLKNHILDFY